jgi:hypothetical protein
MSPRAQDRTPPTPTGQCGQVFNLVERNPGILSLTMTADFAIPEAAARIHDLRSMGFNILTTIRPVVVFRGVERRNVASYALGVPAWPAPGYFDAAADATQLDLDLRDEAHHEL